MIAVLNALDMDCTACRRLNTVGTVCSVKCFFETFFIINIFFYHFGTHFGKRNSFI